MEWDKRGIEACQNLTESMPKRSGKGKGGGIQSNRI